MSVKPKLFLAPAVEVDLKTSLTAYQQNLTIDQFAARVINCLREDQITRCDIHSFKSGSFGIILKIVVDAKNTTKVYFLKFYRNRTPLPEYTPERMKILCQREYLTLKTAHQGFLGTPNGIGVITPIGILADTGCFITAASDGEDLQKHLCTKIKRYFLNPSNRFNKRSLVSLLERYIERIAKLLAAIHELELDYKLFEENEPFHVLDFEYKSENFLKALHHFDIPTYQKARSLVGMLTQKARHSFSSLPSTGLATPDTNLTNFIIEKNKICMMDFFLIQHGPCYQPLGKFIACFELILYGFFPPQIIKKLREKFIAVYQTHAHHHVLDQGTLDFFINWNFMTFLPRFGAPWKYFYQRRIFQTKLELIFKNWRDTLK